LKTVANSGQQSVSVFIKMSAHGLGYLGATIEEGLRFRHKPYMYLYSSEEGELTQGGVDLGGFQTPKGGLREGRGEKPIFI
jgi:hypothetical protein